MQYSVLVKHSIRQTINDLNCFATSNQKTFIYLLRVLSSHYSHVMILLSSWFFSLCDCFASELMIDIVVFKTSQRIYQIHRDHFLCCKWYLQVERVRDMHAKQAQQQVRLVDWNQAIQQCIQIILQSMKQIISQKQEQNDEKLRAEQARLIQQQIDEKVKEVRIEKKRQEVEKIKAETFACRRCFVKFSSNIKLHEHIRDHHAKKSKFAVSNSSTTSITSSQSVVIISLTLFESIIFLFDSSKSASQSKTLRILSSTSSTSIFLSSFTSKRIISSKISSLSSFASEFVSKRSKIASIVCSLTSSHTFVAMRSTLFFKSIFDIFTKIYLTIIDLYIMFAEKFTRAKLFSSQNSSFFSNVFVTYQTRIIAYFLFVKSTQFKLFTSMHDSIKQSTRVSFLRFSFSSSRFSFSIRFLFSTSFYFSSVCWRCQESFVICLSRS